MGFILLPSPTNGSNGSWETLMNTYLFYNHWCFIKNMSWSEMDFINITIGTFSQHVSLVVIHGFLEKSALKQWWILQKILVERYKANIQNKSKSFLTWRLTEYRTWPSILGGKWECTDFWILWYWSLGMCWYCASFLGLKQKHLALINYHNLITNTNNNNNNNN